MRRVIARMLAEAPAPAAYAGRLDLDHVGAIAREVHGAVRSGHALRQIQDLYAFERKIVFSH